MPGGAHENMKAWEPEEDAVIREQVRILGPKWATIVDFLPGRTVSSVRNRFQRMEKGDKLREEGKESRNRCHLCKLPKKGHTCLAKMRGGPQVDLIAPPAVATMAPLALTDGLPSGGAEVMGRPSLKRSRSGSKLVPVEHRQPLLQGGGDEAAASEAPTLQRSNTSSFLRDIFLPAPRELLLARADSPRDASSAAYYVAADDAAPPSLDRVASREWDEPPKLTRSLASYVRDAFGDAAAPPAAPPLAPPSDGLPAPSLSRQSSLDLLALACQPSLPFAMAPPGQPPEMQLVKRDLSFASIMHLYSSDE